MSDATSIHDDKLSTHVSIWLALLALATAAVASSFLNLGIFNTLIVLVIAFTQTTLIFTFSMHLKGAPGLLKLLVIGAFIFVAVMFGMTYNDLASRDFVGGKVTSASWVTRSPLQYSQHAALPHEPTEPSHA